MTTYIVIDVGLAAQRAGRAAGFALPLPVAHVLFLHRSPPESLIDEIIASRR
jgi:hypothetical protein